MMIMWMTMMIMTTMMTIYNITKIVPILVNYGVVQ